MFPFLARIRLHDYLNRWVARSIDADGSAGGGSTETTHYVHDGRGPSGTLSPWERAEVTAEAVGQIVLQLDDAGAPTHRYLWGPAVDQILADEVVDNGGAEDVRWPLTDHLGTVRDLVSSSGSIVQHRTIDSFGKIVQETTAVDHLFALSGRPLDPDTGLQNHLNRWYDPEVGRWLSEDPIGIEGGDANYYRYCDNSPADGVDPNGLVTRAGSWREMLGEWNMRPKRPEIAETIEEVGAAIEGIPGGLLHGSAMIANAATFHQIDSLDTYVDQIVETHGGVYGLAEFSANVGVYSGYGAITLAAGPSIISAAGTGFNTAAGAAEAGFNTVVGGTTMVYQEGGTLAIHLLTRPAIMNGVRILGGWEAVGNALSPDIPTTPGGAMFVIFRSILEEYF